MQTASAMTMTAVITLLIVTADHIADDNNSGHHDQDCNRTGTILIMLTRSVPKHHGKGSVV